jgi:5'-nucleotidase
VHAPGIRALAAALRAVGEVWVVAPDREVSACAQSLTLGRPLRAELLEERVYSVDGTPADCVNLALVKLLPRKPALVVTGINRGANVGEDVFYSGTVGGAREGVFYGLPAIAVSMAARADHAYEVAAAFSARLAAMVLEKGLPERTLLNVNVPPGPARGVVVTRQGRREQAGPAIEGTDVHAVRAGLISITPLFTDTTHHEVLARFREWEPALRGAGEEL